MSRQIVSQFCLCVSLSGVLLASEPDVGFEIVTHMPCAVRTIDVRPGDHVTAGQALFSFESMKMLHTVTAPRDGYVGEIPVEVNATLPAQFALTRLYNAPPQNMPTTVMPLEAAIEEISPDATLAPVEEQIHTISPLDDSREETPVSALPYVAVEVLDPMPIEENTLANQMEEVAEEDTLQELPTPSNMTPPDAPESFHASAHPWEGASFIAPAPLIHARIPLGQVAAPSTMSLERLSIAPSQWPPSLTLQSQAHEAFGRIPSIETMMHTPILERERVHGGLFEQEVLSAPMKPWVVTPFEGGLITFERSTASAILRASWCSLVDMFTTPLGFLVLLLTLSLPYMPAPPFGRVFLPLRAR